MTGSPAVVTVVIAAKNESATIGDLVARARAHAQEVIVVDGWSRDDTVEQATRAGARTIREDGRGKGRALRTAIPLLTTPIAVFLDADGSHLPEDIPRLIAPIIAGDADHVSGSRLMGGSSELHGGFDEFLRLAGSALITACINARFGVRLSDSQNGFRAIRTEALRSIRLVEDSTTFEQELIIKTLGLGYRLSEVPTHEWPRRFGRSHIIVWKAAPRYGYSLIKYLYLQRPSRWRLHSVADAVLPVGRHAGDSRFAGSGSR
jgi:dolichol-phosphate hexosyltransferase